MRKKKKLKDLPPYDREVESLKQKAWKLVSQYVRLRDKHCVTCGGDASQAGHYHHNRLDFNEININAQCSGCNMYQSGKLDQYALYLEEKYGFGILQYLKALKAVESHKAEKRGKYLSWALTPELLQRIINYYESKISKLS